MSRVFSVRSLVASDEEEVATLTDVRDTLSSNPDLLRRLLEEALGDLPASQLAPFLKDLARITAQAQADHNPVLVVDWLEGVAITHALRGNPEYRVAVKDVDAHGGAPVPEDMDALRARLSA